MAVRSVSYRTSGSTSFTCPVPPDLVAGDRLIAAQWSDADTSDSLGTPTGGWALLTQVDTQTALGAPFEGSTYQLHAKIWIRKAGDSEPATYGFTQGAGADGVVVIAAVSGASNATPRFATVTAGPAAHQVTAPSVNLPSGTGTVLCFGAGTDEFGVDANWTVSGGLTRWTPTHLQSGSFVNAVLGARDLSSAGATGTADLDSHWTQRFLHGVTIVVPDASSGGATTPPVPPPTIPALSSNEEVVHYSYEFCDLLTDELICKDLDLFDVGYERRIIVSAPFTASCVITDDVTAAKVARILPRHPEDLSTGPGRTVCHVYRNGVIWGSFVIWRGDVSQAGRDQPIQVKLDGSSLESYLSQVKIRDNLGPYDQVDQVDIARSLLDTMQGTARYDINLSLQAGTSGVLRDRTYLASESSTYGDRLAELAQVEGGFEWYVAAVDNGDGTRTRFWIWGYPTVGSAASHTFTQPGAVLSWAESVNGLGGGTAFQARGESVQDDASQTSEPLVSNIMLATAHLAAGWPGLDKTYDYSSVSEQATLDEYATWWAANRPGAVRVHQATVRLPANTSFGPGNLGDRVTLMLVNAWWPVVNGVASFAKSWRVVGMAFKPPAKGSGQEECTLIFEETDAGGA